MPDMRKRNPSQFMNNLILITVLLSSGALIFISAKGWQKNIAGSNAELVQHVESLRLQLQQRQSAVKQLKELASTRKFQTGVAREELSAARAEALLAIPLAPDPVREGFWPAEQPYFPLAKRYLREIGYRSFTREQQVTRAAAILFGLTPQEKTEVENAAQNFQSAMAQLESQRAEKIERPPEEDSDQHRQISFRLPQIEPNEIRDLQRELEQALTSVLGPQRADLFIERAVEQQLDEWITRGKTPHDKVITLQAERNADGTVMHRIEVKQGGVQSSGTFSFPLEPWDPLWRWRHLFGDRPLLEEDPGASIHKIQDAR
jgi:hypothetical protein